MTFLSKFWGNFVRKEGQEFRSLELRGKLISLKKAHCKTYKLNDFVWNRRWKKWPRFACCSRLKKQKLFLYVWSEHLSPFRFVNVNLELSMWKAINFNSTNEKWGRIFCQKYKFMITKITFAPHKGIQKNLCGIWTFD